MGKELELFSSLFESHPNISILNIHNRCDDIKVGLENIVNSIGGTLKYKDINDIDQKRFRLTAREYEYVVVCDCLDKIEDMKRFIDQIYHSLENSAQIILIGKKEKSDPYSMLQILEEADFRAMNQIDIFENYHLVMAKKMHMWGNGL